MANPCQDYNITYYCAEFVNSVTNLMFIWLGILGIRDCIRFRHRPVFVVACIGYIVVGLGSIAFHTTLKCEPPPVPLLFLSFSNPSLTYQTPCNSPTSCP